LIKKRRLDEIIKKQNIHSLERNQLRINNDYKVLIEGYSKKSKNFLKGRTSENKMVIFPKKDRLLGDYVDVKIKDCNSATLFGELC
jgi:tRNA-2-methylthio-N6-dimethylallyladenosine synthase